MKDKRRSEWFLWHCDREACPKTATTHPATSSLPAVEDSDIPEGWIVIEPPKFWRGPALAFCSVDHRNEWAQATVGPLLLGAGG